MRRRGRSRLAGDLLVCVAEDVCILNDMLGYRYGLVGIV